MCDKWVASIGAAVYRQDGQALVELFGCLNPTDGSWRSIPPFVTAGQAGQVLTNILELLALFFQMLSSVQRHKNQA